MRSGIKQTFEILVMGEIVTYQVETATQPSARSSLRAEGREGKEEDLEQRAETVKQSSAKKKKETQPSRKVRKCDWPKMKMIIDQAVSQWQAVSGGRLAGQVEENSPFYTSDLLGGDSITAR